jgi:hypothetical protein
VTCLALAAAAVPASNALGVAAGGLEFAEWTAVSSNSATGTLAARPVTLSGTHVSAPPASVVDGSAPVFSGSSFSPALPASDAIEIHGSNPAGDYTLDLGSPTPNPVIHLASFGSTLTFPAGTEISRVSGDPTLTVAGHTVSGIADNATDDSDGTIRLLGRFTQIEFTAQYGGPSPDGIFVQAGADFAVPETTITFGVADGTEVGDAHPEFEFVSSEAGSTFECRAYDPTSAAADAPEKTFLPCASPFRPSTPTFELGQQTLFEVRAVDGSGNADPTPATRTYVRHTNPKKLPMKSKCDPVPMDKLIGKGLMDNCRISEVIDGKVGCVNPSTGKGGRCAFSKRGSRWMRSRSDRIFAVVGDPVAKREKGRKRFVVAAPVGDKDESPCAEIDKKDRPRAERDAPSTAEVGTPLSTMCRIELGGSAWNRSGKPMDNFATRPVCMNNWNDLWIDLASTVGAGSPEPGVRCFYGEGAGLNDPNGTERQSNGQYFAGGDHCHIVMHNGWEVYAAKRPNIQGIPPPPRAVKNSASLWRPYYPGVAIAN